MPKKKCGFSFSCASMMMQPGLEAADCPNYQVCGSATELAPDEQVQLVRVRQEEQRRWEEQIRVSRREAAIMMLMSRACPQSPDSLGLSQLLVHIQEQLSEARSRLFRLEGKYIAPEQCQVHQYNVKRPTGTYWYNKLTADEPLFEPAERTQKVCVIHLSRDKDPRNEEGRLGLERRNQLIQARTRLRAIESALNDVLELLEIIGT